MKIPSSNPGRTCCAQKLFLTFRTIFVHNMFSPCSAKRRASDKDLPVFMFFRSYTLPRGCKSEDVTSNLSADGVLMITAAKKKSIQEASRKVPIEMKK